MVAKGGLCRERHPAYNFAPIPPETNDIWGQGTEGAIRPMKAWKNGRNAHYDNLAETMAHINVWAGIYLVPKSQPNVNTI